MIFGIIKLEFKLKTFKAPRVGKERNIKTLNLNTIISLHQDLSRQGTEGFSNSGAEEQIFMSETVVLWESFLQTNVCHKKQTSTCVICSFNMSVVMCCWNILHKNKGSSSAFRWNSWIWNRTERMTRGRGILIWNAQAKIESTTTAAARSSLNSLYPATEPEPRGFKEANMWVPDTYIKSEPVSTTGIKLHQAFIQTIEYF